MSHKRRTRELWKNAIEKMELKKNKINYYEIFDPKYLKMIIEMLGEIDKPEMFENETKSRKIQFKNGKISNHSMKINSSGITSKNPKEAQDTKIKELKIKKRTREDNFINILNNFFENNDEDCRKWRPARVLAKEEMNLQQKANFLTEKISVEFCEWLENLGGNYQVDLKPEKIREMFKIRDIFEKPSVEKSYTITKLNFFKSAKHDPKWSKIKEKHTKLINMETVWKDITHLKSTKRFYNYLCTQKNLKPPLFLKKSSFL